MVYLHQKCFTCGKYFLIKESEVDNNRCGCGNIHCYRCVRALTGPEGDCECAQCMVIWEDECSEFLD